MLKLLLFVSGIVFVAGHSSGAGTCDVQNDGQNIGMSNNKQSNPGAYTARAASAVTGQYRPDEVIPVTLSGPQFTGVLGYFQSGGVKHGRFITSGNVQNQCSGSTNTAVFTHTSNFGNVQTTGADWTLSLYSVAPAITSSAAGTAAFTVTLAYQGTVYAVLVLASDSAPTPAQIKAGQNSAGTAAVSSDSQTGGVGSPLTVSLNNVDSATSYTIYIVTEANTPTVSFLWYLLSGTRGASTDFYRGFTGDAGLVTLAPQTTPSQSAVATLPVPATGQSSPSSSPDSSSSPSDSSSSSYSSSDSSVTSSSSSSGNDDDESAALSSFGSIQLAVMMICMWLSYHLL